MARWRTHNKRAKRRLKRDAEFTRDCNELITKALATAMEGAFKKLADDFARAAHQLASAMGKIMTMTETHWLPLDPKYTGLRRGLRDEWPEVILEDVLDAEFIE